MRPSGSWPTRQSDAQDSEPTDLLMSPGHVPGIMIVLADIVEVRLPFQDKGNDGIRSLAQHQQLNIGVTAATLEINTTCELS